MRRGAGGGDSIGGIGLRARSARLANAFDEEGVVVDGGGVGEGVVGVGSRSYHSSDQQRQQQLSADEAFARRLQQEEEEAAAANARQQQQQQGNGNDVGGVSTNNPITTNDTTLLRPPRLRRDTSADTSGDEALARFLAAEEERMSGGVSATSRVALTNSNTSNNTNANSPPRQLGGGFDLPPHSSSGGVRQRPTHNTPTQTSSSSVATQQYLEAQRREHLSRRQAQWEAMAGGTLSPGGGAIVGLGERFREVLRTVIAFPSDLVHTVRVDGGLSAIPLVMSFLISFFFQLVALTLDIGIAVVGTTFTFVSRKLGLSE